MRRGPPVFIVATAAVAAIVVLVYVRNAPPHDPDRIAVSGTLEMTTARLAFETGGTLASRAASEGDRVAAGQELAALDATLLAEELALREADVRAAEAFARELEEGSRPEEIDRADAAVRAARARVSELEAGARPEEIAVAQAAVRSARSQADLARTEHERLSALRLQDSVSARDLDAARAAMDATAARLVEAEERLALVKAGARAEQVEQARAALASTEHALALVRAGARTAQRDQARARLDAARAGAAVARTRLMRARIVAPFGGVILAQHAEPGEFLAPGAPVVTIGDPGDMWLRTYIDERDLERVKLGARATIVTDTLPRSSFEGRVTYIASEAEFTPRDVQTQKERVKLVFRARIAVDGASGALKAGMPADAVIRVGEGGVAETAR